MRFWPSLTFLLIALPLQAATIFHQPITPGVTGVPVRIKASIDNPNEFLYARLFYKKASSGFFKQVTMRGSGRRFTGEIAGSDMVAQGTQYYIAVTLQDQSTITVPSGAPGSLYTIKNNEAGTALNISIVSPKDGQRVDQKRPEVTAAIRGLEYLGRREKIILFIDDARVTHDFSFGFLRHKPENDFSLGRHQIRVQILDEKGTLLKEEKSTFYVEAELDPEDKIKILEDQKKNAQTIEGEQDKWKKSGNLKLTYQYAKTEPVTTSVANPNGYYSVEAQYLASKDKTSFFLGPMYITDQASEGGSRIEKMSFGVSHHNMATKWGTISTELTELTDGGVAFLGGEVAYDSLKDEKKTGFRIKSFSGESREPVAKALDPSNVGIYRQRAYGGQLAWAPIKNLGYFSTQVIHKSDDVSSIPEISLNQARQDTAVSAYAKIFLPKLTLTELEAEYGVTAYDTKTPVLTDAQELVLNNEKNNGQGFYVRGQGNVKSIATKYNFDFRRNDPRFLYDGDLLSAKGDLTHTLFKGGLTLSERVNYETDNLENQKIQTTSNRGAGVDASISAGRYSLNVSDNINQQTITGDNLTQQNNQVSNDLNSDAAVNFKFWRLTLSPGVTFSQQDVIDLSSPRLVDDQRTRTYQGKLAVQLRLTKWVKFYGDAAYTYSTVENLTQGSTNQSQSPSGNINLDFKLIKGKLLWQNKGSYELNSIITKNPDAIQINSIQTTKYETDMKFTLIKWVEMGSDFSFERNENKEGPQDNLNLSIGITRAVGASMTFKLFADKLSVPLTGNHSVTFDSLSPQKTNSETVTTTAGITFRPDQIQTLQVDGSFTRFLDKVTGPNSYDQYSVTFSYNAVLE